MHELATGILKVSVMHETIPIVCSLICGTLMNIRDKLVMVAQMLHKFFHGFVEFDNVICIQTLWISSGSEQWNPLWQRGSLPQLFTGFCFEPSFVFASRYFLWKRILLPRRFSQIELTGGKKKSSCSYFYKNFLFIFFSMMSYTVIGLIFFELEITAKMNSNSEKFHDHSK